MLGANTTNVDHEQNAKVGRYPGRRATVIFNENFAFIQQIQMECRCDKNQPHFDHGQLVSAALALIAQMPNAKDQIVNQALQMCLEKQKDRCLA